MSNEYEWRVCGEDLYNNVYSFNLQFLRITSNSCIAIFSFSPQSLAELQRLLSLFYHFDLPRDTVRSSRRLPIGCDLFHIFLCIHYIDICWTNQSFCLSIGLPNFAHVTFISSPTGKARYHPLSPQQK